MVRTVKVCSRKALLSRCLPVHTEENHKYPRDSRYSDEIWTVCLPNASLKCCHNMNLLVGKRNRIRITNDSPFLRAYLYGYYQVRYSYDVKDRVQYLLEEKK